MRDREGEKKNWSSDDARTVNSSLNIWKYLIGGWRPKWPNTTIFGNFKQKNTVSEINGKVPLFLELEFQKLEFQKLEFLIKKILWYSSLVDSSTIYTVLKYTKLEYLFLKIKKIKIYTILEFGKLEYYVIFFFLKKVLKLGILEYCVAWYSSLPSSSTT